MRAAIVCSLLLLACAGKAAAAQAQESAKLHLLAGDHGYTRCSFSVRRSGHDETYGMEISVSIGLMEPAKGLVRLDQPAAQVPAQRVTIAAGGESLLDIELERQANAYSSEMGGAAASALIRKIMQYKEITVGFASTAGKRELTMAPKNSEQPREQVLACLKSVEAESLENRIDYPPR
jgi:hypothetical protein